MEESANLEDRSCALENFPSTYVDLSKLTESTLPSLSIEESQMDHDFLLKEYYEKLDQLRKENFDLKLKIYLLESNEKMTPESELKFKVINEFEKKNNEIKSLKEKLEKQSKETAKLRKLADNRGEMEVYVENDQLKTKLSDAVQICSELVLTTEQLVQLTNKGVDEHKLSATKECIDKATVFLSDSSFSKLESSGILKKILNRKTNRISKPSDSQPVKTSSTGTTDSAHARSSQTIAQNSKQNTQEAILKEFMGVVSKLRSLIDDFRANRLMYKDFSTKLDDLFETLDKQYRFLEQLQLSQLESDSRLKSAEKMLKYEAAFKDRIKVDLAKSMNKLESIISKTKQIA